MLSSVSAVKLYAVGSVRNNRSWPSHDWNCRQSPFQMADEVSQKCFSVLMPPGILSIVWLMFVYLQQRWISASLLDAMTFNLSLKNCRCHRSRIDAQNRSGLALYAARDGARQSFQPSRFTVMVSAGQKLECLSLSYYRVMFLTCVRVCVEPSALCVLVLDASPRLASLLLSRFWPRPSLIVLAMCGVSLKWH